MNEYINSQINKAVQRMNDIGVIDSEFGDDVLMDDLIFEYWDNIATELYLTRGGKMETQSPNYPVNERMFNDCQNDATDMIEQARQKESK